MAGIRVGVLRAIEGHHGISDFRIREHTRIDQSFNLTPESSITSYESLPSKESSIDLKPNINLYSLLKKKHEQVNFLTKKLKFFDILACFMGISGTILAVSSTRLQSPNNFYSKSVSILITISTSFMLVSLIYSSYFSFSITREKQLGLQNGCTDRFLKSKALKRTLLEIFIYIYQPLPFYDKTFAFEQLNGTLSIRLDEIFSSLMLIRVFLLFKILKHYSKWTNEHSTAICDLYAARADIFYALRALLKENPIMLISILMSISTLVLSIALQTFEKNFHSFDSSLDYSYLWNSMWLVMLTMTTVGYGEFYPKTHIGRFILVIATVWGIFIVSLMILSLTNFSLLTPPQTRSYSFIKKVGKVNSSKKYAIKFVVSVIELFVMNRKQKKKHMKLTIPYKLMKIKGYFRKFKELKVFKTDMDDNPQEMLRSINEMLAVKIMKIVEILADAKNMDEQLDYMLSSQENSLSVLRKACDNMRKNVSILENYNEDDIECEDL
ncbi:hypothetical protein SteCoe_9397 [Stentor coeruleus]|uniref:Potassium channel domain-containing protein n=1 Tax=Stentor coeruleus TaxID=5963 RepID=A0A1R2CHY2_9CILI|nr:hypothetical protein SteCoe_9397 [Stentor coeruleus]